MPLTGFDEHLADELADRLRLISRQSTDLAADALEATAYTLVGAGIDLWLDELSDIARVAAAHLHDAIELVHSLHLEIVAPPAPMTSHRPRIDDRPTLDELERAWRNLRWGHLGGSAPPLTPAVLEELELLRSDPVRLTTVEGARDERELVAELRAEFGLNDDGDSSLVGLFALATRLGGRDPGEVGVLLASESERFEIALDAELAVLLVERPEVAAGWFNEQGVEVTAGLARSLVGNGDPGLLGVFSQALAGAAATGRLVFGGRDLVVADARSDVAHLSDASFEVMLGHARFPADFAVDVALASFEVRPGQRDDWPIVMSPAGAPEIVDPRLGALLGVIEAGAVPALVEALAGTQRLTDLLVPAPHGYFLHPSSLLPDHGVPLPTMALAALADSQHDAATLMAAVAALADDIGVKDLRIAAGLAMLVFFSLRDFGVPGDDDPIDRDDVVATWQAALTGDPMLDAVGLVDVLTAELARGWVTAGTAVPDLIGVGEFLGALLAVTDQAQLAHARDRDEWNQRGWDLFRSIARAATTTAIPGKLAAKPSEFIARAILHFTVERGIDGLDPQSEVEAALVDDLAAARSSERRIAALLAAGAVASGQVRDPLGRLVAVHVAIDTDGRPAATILTASDGTVLLPAADLSDASIFEGFTVDLGSGPVAFADWLRRINELSKEIDDGYLAHRFEPVG